MLTLRSRGLKNRLASRTPDEDHRLSLAHTPKIPSETDSSDTTHNEAITNLIEWNAIHEFVFNDIALAEGTSANCARYSQSSELARSRLFLARILRIPSATWCFGVQYRLPLLVTKGLPQNLQSA